jgi:hypothetical protein
MTTMAQAGGARTPWHYWLVTAIGVLWNGFGAYDYVASNTKGDAYLRSMGMTEHQIAYFHAMPAGMTGVWALGVWGAALGAVLLLFRSRWALHAFVASLVGLLVSLVYTYVLSNGAEVMGQQGAIMNAVILAGAVFFIWYARRMTKRGVLR